MLLAELHGKRFPEVEGVEDWLTSAIFGNLRQVSPPLFWPSLLRRAMSVGVPQVSLAGELNALGIRLDQYTELTTVFWKDCGNYGEPDLILRFTGQNVFPLLLVVEVKLNSTKSGIGTDDQLAKYLALLDNPAALPAWTCARDLRYVIYLTRAFAKLELEESVLASGKPDAERRIFGLEWRDVLETAQLEASSEELLAEVAQFLKGRGFEAFRGFRTSQSLSVEPIGGFYGSEYFSGCEGPIWTEQGVTGRFYGN
jgi:hypothetical protein